MIISIYNYFFPRIYFSMNGSCKPANYLDVVVVSANYFGRKAYTLYQKYKKEQLFWDNLII